MPPRCLGHGAEPILLAQRLLDDGGKMFTFRIVIETVNSLLEWSMTMNGGAADYGD